MKQDYTYTLTKTKNGQGPVKIKDHRFFLQLSLIGKFFKFWVLSTRICPLLLVVRVYHELTMLLSRPSEFNKLSTLHRYRFHLLRNLLQIYKPSLNEKWTWTRKNQGSQIFCSFLPDFPCLWVLSTRICPLFIVVRVYHELTILLSRCTEFHGLSTLICFYLLRNYLQVYKPSLNQKWTRTKKNQGSQVFMKL